MEYVTGRDTYRATAGAYNLQWRPWTVIIDRRGIVRAGASARSSSTMRSRRSSRSSRRRHGVYAKTRRVKTSRGRGRGRRGGRRKNVVVAPDIEPVPQEWMEASYARYETLKPMIDKMAPELEVETWRNSFERRSGRCAGRSCCCIFWSIDSERCLAMAKLLDTSTRIARRTGLVVIGVTDRVSGDDLTRSSASTTSTFPSASTRSARPSTSTRSTASRTSTSIGQAGRLRGADIKTRFIPENDGYAAQREPVTTAGRTSRSTQGAFSRCRAGTRRSPSPCRA